MATPIRIYSPCSGQSGRGVLKYPRKNDWGICLADPFVMPWWRARDKAGRLRLFPTYAAAETFALQLEKEKPRCD